MGGADHYTAHQIVDFPMTGGWTHVELTLGSSNGRWTYGLLLDGTTVDSNFLAAAFDAVGSASTSVGAVYVRGAGVRKFYVDNVLIEAR